MKTVVLSRGSTVPISITQTNWSNMSLYITVVHDMSSDCVDIWATYQHTHNVERFAWLLRVTITNGYNIWTSRETMLSIIINYE